MKISKNHIYKLEHPVKEVRSYIYNNMTEIIKLKELLIQWQIILYEINSNGRFIKMLIKIRIKWEVLKKFSRISKNKMKKI